MFSMDLQSEFRGQCKNGDRIADKELAASDLAYLASALWPRF